MNGEQLNKLVSVIIPTYNNAKYLPHTIQTVLNQTYQPLEVIVVDDGSTDDTVEALNPFRDKIFYFYKDNAGVSRARNFGISQARGRYIAFLDADDLWHRDKLKQQVEVLDNNPNCGLVCTDYAVFKDDQIITASEKKSRRFPKNHELWMRR